MTKRDLWRNLSAAFAAMYLCSCNLINPESSYRFRMTVTVQTPTGIRTGSAVMEVVAYKEPIIIGDRGGGHSGLGGEAVVIDTPEGLIFALLTAGEGMPRLPTIVTQTFAPETRRGDFDTYLAAVRRLGRAKEKKHIDYLPEFATERANGVSQGDRLWPLLVTLRDRKNPHGFELADPAMIKIVNVKLESTRDPITRTIMKYIPSPGGNSGYEISNDSNGNRESSIVRSDYFFMGDER